MKNRKNKITNLLKTGILLFGISLLLWNCEKEEINIKPENNLETKTPFRVATFESIAQKKEFKELIEKSKIKPFFEKNSKGQYLGKNNSNEIDYIVVKETVKIIEHENYTSYTFLVENNDNTTHNSSFINLVIEKNEENINAFLIKYTPSKEFLLSKNMPFSGELSIKRVNYDKTLLSKQQNLDCGWVENYTLRNCTEHGTSGIYNRACDNYGKDAFAYSTTYVCGYGGGSSFSQLSYFSNDNYGGGSSSPSTTNTSTQTAPVYPCGDEIHGCDKKINILANEIGVDKSLLEDLSEEILDELSSLNDLKVNIESLTTKTTFDPLTDAWLDKLREYAQRLENLKDKISEDLWEKLNKYVNEKLIELLSKTALKFNKNASIDNETYKQLNFKKYPKLAVGNLLYEFANGQGPDLREFKDGEFWNSFFEGDRISKIKTDFQNILSDKNLTFEQFVAKGDMLPSSYKFSPDHAGVKESFEEHKNANWVQFFVGGSRIEYRPSNQIGYVDVKLINPTGRNSLLLHVGEDYDRSVYGNIPLSTIRQHFYISIKIK